MGKASYPYRRAKAVQRRVNRAVEAMERKFIVLDMEKGTMSVLQPMKYGGELTDARWTDVAEVYFYSLFRKSRSSFLERLKFSLKICWQLFRNSSQASSEK